MIRFFCVILFLLLFSIISLPMYLIVNIIGHFSPMKKGKISQSFVVWGFKMVLFASGTTLKAEGQENVPKDTPAAVIQSGTTSRQQTVVATLETIDEACKMAQILLVTDAAFSPAPLVSGPIWSIRMLPIMMITLSPSGGH